MLPPVRLPKCSMAVKAKASAPQPPYPNHLRGLDKPCCVRSNPHRESGTRSRAAADGRAQTGTSEGGGSRPAEEQTRGPFAQLQQERRPFPAPLSLGAWFVRSSLPKLMQIARGRCPRAVLMHSLKLHPMRVQRRGCRAQCLPWPYSPPHSSSLRREHLHPGSCERDRSLAPFESKDPSTMSKASRARAPRGKRPA
jgi:hypothetical protein